LRLSTNIGEGCARKSSTMLYRNTLTSLYNNNGRKERNLGTPETV